MFCPHCGTSVANGASFCPQCGGRQPPATPPQNQPQKPLEPPPAPRRKIYEPQRDQIPDPTFSKFIDAPDPPLPFWFAKVVISIFSIVAAATAVWEAYARGTIDLILGRGETDGADTGVYLVIIALLLLVCAVCGFASKRSKGAAGCGAACFFFSSAFSFFQYLDEPTGRVLLVLSVSNLIFAIVFLVSAAGGIRPFDTIDDDF